MPRATRSRVTYTLNFFFGNGKIAGDTGFFLNNEMDDFTSKPGVPNAFGLVQGEVNAGRPGKRPLSSMTPTIVLKDGRLFMVTGSPGGSTIISTTLESIINIVDFGMNMQQAVDAPRIHHQWLPDIVFVEPGYLTPQTQAALEAMGYQLQGALALGCRRGDPARSQDGPARRRQRQPPPRGAGGRVLSATRASSPIGDRAFWR